MTLRKHSPMHDLWHRRVEGQLRHAFNAHPEWLPKARESRAMSADDQPDQVTYTVLACRKQSVQFLLCVPDGADLEGAVMAELDTLAEEGKLPETDPGEFARLNVEVVTGLSLTDNLDAVAEYNTGEVMIDVSGTPASPAAYRHVLKDRAGRRYRFAYRRSAVVVH